MEYKDLYKNFCFGRERRIAVTPVLDGVVTIGVFLLLGAHARRDGRCHGVDRQGMHREFADKLSALLQDTGESIGEYAAGLVGRAGRFVLLAVVGVGLAYAWRALSPVAGHAAAAVLTVLYVAEMAPIALRAPVGVYVRRAPRRAIPATRGSARCMTP